MLRSGPILSFSMLLLFLGLLLFSSCRTSKLSTVKEDQKKELPAAISLPPSSFLCEAKVIGLDSLQSKLLIMNMIRHGAALYYSVGIGDTIQAKIYSYQRSNLSVNSITELVIEERLKLNSEIPDFIIRQIISGRK